MSTTETLLFAEDQLQTFALSHGTTANAWAETFLTRKVPLTVSLLGGFLYKILLMSLSKLMSKAIAFGTAKTNEK